MRIALRGQTIDGVAIDFAPARPLPLDWELWRDKVVGEAPLAPVVEEYTEPLGWSVTIVEVEAKMHAFYAVLDRAIHATADVANDPALRARVRALFKQAEPVFDDEIAALADL
jgi:hypothetical protein